MISGQYRGPVGLALRCVAMLTAFAASLYLGETADAQIAGGGFGFGRVGVVGGISVDAQGAVRDATVEERRAELEMLRRLVTGGDLSATDLRVVSLRGLQAEVEAAISEKRPISEDARFLAGLQRIEYVFVDQENHDILLAGPAEGWIVREDASVVGKKSGRPVIQLVDLLTALATVDATRNAPISVSIEPTAEGQRNISQLLSKVRTGPGFNPQSIEPAMREAFGPQVVKLSTVAEDSRMAHTLLAADYQMKRLAMHLEPSPISDLPSYMTMIRNGGKSHSTQPRWWIACEYDAIKHSADNLAWQISGLGVRAMTEDEYVDSKGNRSGTGKSNRLAQKWADGFTENFDKLCATHSTFGDLRNLMDLNVVATIIAGHELEQLAGCDLSVLRSDSLLDSTPRGNVPKTLQPQCSFVKGTQGWVVSASGGVEINPWRVVATQSKLANDMQTVQGKATAGRTGNWWWD